MRALSLMLLLACADKDHQPSDDTGAPPDDSAADDSADDSGQPDSDDSGDSGSTDRWEAVRDQVATDLRRSLATGASVAVMVGGEVVFAEGFGTADPDGDVPVTTETLFNIGSDTKKITAISLLQQVEAGRLSLDDTLDEALPGFSFASDPDLAGEITLRHLLTHTSGLYDDTNWAVDPDDAALAEYTYGEFAANEIGMMPPGLAWNYSNPNFSLAGLAAERVSGQAWGDLVEADVFGPLGMDHSYTRLSEVMEQPDVALGYGILNVDEAAGLSIWESLDFESEVGTMPLEDFPDGAWVRPAGGVWSTPTDMLKLASFLMNGDTSVLSDASRGDLLTDHVPFYPDLPILGYGYGMMIYNEFTWLDGEWHEVPMWFHGGNHLAYTSAFYVLPEQGIAVSVLSNGYGDDFSSTVWTAIDAALEGANLPNVIEGPSLEADPSTFGQYEGTWVEPEMLGTMALTLDGEDLKVSLPDVSALGYTYRSTLAPNVPGLFLLTIEGYPIDLTFITPDGEETPQYGVNRGLVFAREDDAPEAIAPPEARRAKIEALLKR